MIRYFTSLCFLLFCISCYNTDLDCATNRRGHFEFTALINRKKETTTFYRNDTLEISRFRGQTDSSVIKWLSSCEYISRKWRPKNITEQKAIRFKILSTNKDGYTFEYGLVGDLKNIKRGFVKKTKTL